MSTQVEQSSPYAPIFYRSTPWWRFADRLAKEGYVHPRGMVRHGMNDFIEQEFIIPCAEASRDRYEGHPEEDWMLANAIAQVHETTHWLPLVAQYLLNGRQIFDLDPALMEQLTHTDLGEATLKGWHAPYDCFYMHFGKQDDVSTLYEDGLQPYLGGAFVAVMPFEAEAGEISGNLIRIGMTTVQEDGTHSDIPAYYLDILPQEQLLPAEKAIDAAIKRQSNNFRQMQFEPSSLSDFKETINEIRAKNTERAGELIRMAAHRIINALFYLETMGRDAGVKGPGRDTPATLTEQWESTPNRRAKLEQGLTRDGYSIVRFVGREFAQGRPSGTGAGTVSTHWRRGHYRDQPYGPQNSLVKRVWIKPTIIAAEKAESTSTPGHIYKAARPR